MKPYYVVVMKRLPTSKREIYCQPSSIAMGELKVDEAYLVHQADQVALIEVDPNAVTLECRMNVIYKIDRVCKHPMGLQWKFNYKAGTMILSCENCRLTFGGEREINEETESLSLSPSISEV